MTRGGCIALLAASHLLVGFAIAAAALWYAQGMFSRVYSTANSMIVISRYAAYVELQRTNGGAQEYRDALLTFLTAIEQVHTHKDALYDDRTYLFDKALTYTRLARIERSTGHSEVADDDFQQAASACNNLGWKDCTPERLIEVSKKLEQHSIFNSADRTPEQR